MIPPNRQADTQPMSSSLQQVSDELTRTRPWAQIAGYLFWIFAAVSTLGLIISLSTAAKPPAEKVGEVIGSLVVIIAYIQLGRFANSYANSISRLRKTQAHQELTQAMENQRSFWKVCGILSLILLVCIGVVTAFAFIGSLL